MCNISEYNMSFKINNSEFSMENRVNKWKK